jgi:hypothetical protein
MKILIISPWPEKVNFVDDKNAFVGFDYESCCCESFGYFLTRQRPQNGTTEQDHLPGEDFPGYNFDTSFHEDDLFPSTDDSGGSVTFRLVNESGEELFLTLYNHHNGYYSHGWEMKEDANNRNAIAAGSI